MSGFVRATILKRWEDLVENRGEIQGVFFTSESPYEDKAEVEAREEELELNTLEETTYYSGPFEEIGRDYIGDIYIWEELLGSALED